MVAGAADIAALAPVTARMRQTDGVEDIVFAEPWVAQASDTHQLVTEASTLAILLAFLACLYLASAAIAARLQRASGQAEAGPSNGLSSSHAATKQAVQQQSEFARKASQIGLSIHKTSAKLQKLALLAKRTSMFDDPTQEIDELTGIIKQDKRRATGHVAAL